MFVDLVTLWGFYLAFASAFPNSCLHATILLTTSHQDTFECDVGNLHVNYIGWNITKRTAQSLVDIDYI
jgi:hypothetical protein